WTCRNRTRRRVRTTRTDGLRTTRPAGRAAGCPGPRMTATGPRRGGPRPERPARAVAGPSGPSFRGHRLEGVGDEVHGDHRTGDGQGREERRPPDARDHVAVLLADA